MKIQKIRIVIVIKGVFSYCLKFRLNITVRQSRQSGVA